MTVGNSEAASVAGSLAARPGHRQPVVGDRLQLRVAQRLDERHYRVVLHDAQRVVNSTVPLTVGSSVHATVTAVGEQLELRYVSSDAVAAAMAEHEAAGEDALAAFEARYSMEIRQGPRKTIQQEMATAGNPQAMALSGMFLSKLSLPVAPASLQAVHGAQSWSMRAASTAAAVDISALLQAHDGGQQSLAALLAGALEDGQMNAATIRVTTDALAQQSTAGIQAGQADTQSDDSNDRRELAHRLLNEQDAGSLAYRYGVLPVIIGDELLELDLVCFHERRTPQPAEGVRRLVMTFRTQTLGRVQIVAQALGERLSIAIKASSPQSSERLATHASQVRELIGRLGWNVESVSYDLDVNAERAARHVLDHVLNADTLSRWV